LRASNSAYSGGKLLIDIKKLTKHQNIDESGDVKTDEKELADKTVKNLTRVRQVILNEYPNGVIFSPMSNRLFENKVGIILDEAMQNALRKQMFRREDNVWLFPEMVANREIQDKIVNTLVGWLTEFGCFSISALRQQVAFEVHNLPDDIKEFEKFLLFLISEYTIASQIKTRTFSGVRIVRSRVADLNTAMTRLGHNIEVVLDAAGGIVTETELLMEIPALDAVLLSAVVKDFLPHIFKTEMNGLICFSHVESLGLPDDFSTQLSETVQKLETLNLDVSETALHTALSLAYRINFSHVYQISDKKTFRNVVAQYFKGETPHVWSRGVFLEVRG
jgi:hypothetical protein